MVGAVDQGRLEVDQREAGQHAAIARGFQALGDAGDEFLRHRAADDLALELVAGARLLRLEHDLDAGELARTARLLLVGVVDFGALGDGFAIRHLRSADVAVHLVLAAQYVDLNLQMQLAHALDDGLA